MRLRFPWLLARAPLASRAPRDALASWKPPQYSIMQRYRPVLQRYRSPCNVIVALCPVMALAVCSKVN